MNSIWIILIAVLAFWLAFASKALRKPWYDAWWKALCGAAGACFVAMLFQLLPPVSAISAAGCGAFLGLCWNPQKTT